MNPMADSRYKNRLVTKKTRIKDVVKGRYFPGSKETMRASYVITPFGERISRMNVLGTITDKFINDSKDYGVIIIDDGTGAIHAKTFGDDVEMFNNVDRGDLAIIIGKIKEYEGETYINAEIVNIIPPEKSNYEPLRRLELLDKLHERKDKIDNLKKIRNHVPPEELGKYAENMGFDQETLKVAMESEGDDYKPKLLKLIDEMDEGNGTEIMKIFEESNLPDAVVERTMDNLLSDGYIFEPSPGRFKVIKA